jgi:hypothetical protein
MQRKGVWHRNFNLFSTQLTELQSSFEQKVDQTFREEIDGLLGLCGDKFPPGICNFILLTYSYEIALSLDIPAFPLDYIKQSTRQINEQVSQHSQAVLQQLDLELVAMTCSFLSPFYEAACIQYACSAVR